MKAHLLRVSASENDAVIDLRSPEYWDIRDIQFHCRVSRSTAWRMVEEPGFPVRVAFGRCVRWPRAEVIEFLEARRAPSVTAAVRPTSGRPSDHAYSARPVRRRSA